MNGIKALLYLFDTNVALYLLKDRLVNPLPTGEYFVSLITEIELLSYSNLTTLEEESIREFLGQVSIVEITAEIKQTTIELRKTYKLKLPDAIISATAKSLGAVLLTNDATLLKIAEIQSQPTPFT